MVTVSDEVLAIAKEKIKEAHKEYYTMYSNSICWGRAVLASNGDEVGAPTWACHSWVTSLYSSLCSGGANWQNFGTPFDKNAENFILLNALPPDVKRSCEKESLQALVKWLATETPFSKYILNRDDSDGSLSDHGMMMLVGPDGLTLAEVMWVCKVVRYATEGDRSLDVWKYLTDNGVNPLLALYVSSSTAQVRGATFGYKSVYTHSNVFTNFAPSIKKLLKFKHNRFAKTTRCLFTDSRSTRTVEDDEKEFFRAFSKPTEVSDGWGGVVISTGSAPKVFLDNVKKWEKKVTPSSSFYLLKSRTFLLLMQYLLNRICKRHDRSA